MSRVLLATDNDEPGQALAEELARRLGRERCWRVRWPQGTDSALLADGARPDGYLKDANEVLLNAGADALRECVVNAEPYPIRGLFRCCASVHHRVCLHQVHIVTHEAIVHLRFSNACRLSGFPIFMMTS